MKKLYKEISKIDCSDGSISLYEVDPLTREDFTVKSELECSVNGEVIEFSDKSVDEVVDFIMENGKGTYEVSLSHALVYDFSGIDPEHEEFFKTACYYFRHNQRYVTEQYGTISRKVKTRRGYKKAIEDFMASIDADRMINKVIDHVNRQASNKLSDMNDVYCNTLNSYFTGSDLYKDNAEYNRICDEEVKLNEKVKELHNKRNSMRIQMALNKIEGMDIPNHIKEHMKGNLDAVALSRGAFSSVNRKIISQYEI
jgi:hypothetical protein